MSDETGHEKQAPSEARTAVSRRIAERILAMLRGVSIRSSSEAELQDALLELFTGNGLAVQREHSLGGGNRIDFLVASHVGVEVKVQSGHAEVTRQIQRYAAHPDIDVMVLVTTRVQHTGIDLTTIGKPSFIAYVGRAFV
jgi:hypothetical protein